MVSAMKTALTALIFFITMALGLPALSAGFIKFDGVDGEATDKDHKGWIDILSVSHSVVPRDAASGHATGKRQHKPLTITKPIDKASPILAEALASGKALSNVTIEVDGRVTELKAAQVIAIEADGKGNEIITLAPSAGKPQDYRPSRTTGKPDSTDARKKGNVETTWKVEEGEK